MIGQEQPQPIPVTLITGFLGSGKTTLLQRLLDSPALFDTAVLINEFGEVGLDHHLIRHVDENIVVLASGCVCCTIRDDLGAAIRDLWARRSRGEIMAFRRLVIETTGLADPVPILHTLLYDPVVDVSFRLHTVITTVDAVNGEMQLARQPEAAKQAAVADRIVITKTDLVDRTTECAIAARLRRLNPSAIILTAPSPNLVPERLLTAGFYSTASKPAEVRAWLNDEAYPDAGHDHHHEHRDVNRHDERIAACCLVFEEPIDWSAFSVWMTMLLHRRGQDVLRIKGLLNVPRLPGPVVIHSVQHVIHTPLHLPYWPDNDRSSRIVLITRDIARPAIAASIAAFNRASWMLRLDAGDVADSFVPMGAGSEIGGRPYRRCGGLAWMK